MAFETKYKKRGSNLSLVLMLIALLALVAAILLWPGAEQPAVEVEPEEEEVLVEEPKADMTDEEREIEATSFCRASLSVGMHLHLLSTSFTQFSSKSTPASSSENIASSTASLP